MSLFQSLFHHRFHRPRAAGRSAFRHRIREERLGRRDGPLAPAEPLEARHLLALVVDAGNLSSFRQASGDYVFSDSSSIEFAAGTVLDAGAGAIMFAAPSVTIGANARLTTSGAVSITASKSFPSLGGVSNLWSQLSTIVEAIGGMRTAVNVRAAAAISAGSFSITASAGDDPTLLSTLSFSGAGTPAIPLLGQVAFMFLGNIVKDDIYALPLSVQVKQPQTTITIDAGATIETTAGDVTIDASATADATGQAIYSVLANDVLGDRGGGIAAGFSYVDASSTVSIAGSVRSSGAAKVASTTTGVAEMTSRVTLNQGLQKTNPKNVEVAYAGTHLQSTSRITVAAGGTIEAGKNVDVTSTVDDTNKLKANTASYRDGLVGVTIGTGWTYGTSEVIVDGTIRAGRVNVPRTVTFDSTFRAVSAESLALGLASPSSTSGKGLTWTVPIDESPAAERTRKGCSPGRQSAVTSSLQVSCFFAASNCVPTQRMPESPRALVSAAVQGANVAGG